MNQTRGNPLPATSPRGTRWLSQRGQSFAEVMIALAVLAFMLVSLYTAFSSGFAVLRVARENLRATQILEERMEVLRLIRYDDAQPGFIPTNFTAAFYINSTNSMIAGGFDYTGKVIITKAPVSESYATDLKMIRIALSWKSGNVIRNREMTTFVSRYGLQNYIY